MGTGGDHAVHQAAKVGAIGAVVAGTTLLARREKDTDAPAE
ncbi:hypothetical protein ACIP2X_16975 [Streptomyces sp. NPDC089424]